MDPSLLRPFIAREVSRAMEGWAELVEILGTTVHQATHGLSNALIQRAPQARGWAR